MIPLDIIKIVFRHVCVKMRESMTSPLFALFLISYNSLGTKLWRPCYECLRNSIDYLHFWLYQMFTLFLICLFFIFDLYFCFSFFFSVVSLSWRAFSIQCKMGWQEWNQACYKLSKDLKPFSNASSICRQSGAELVSIASPQENEFVYNVSGGEEVFIGLHAPKANDSFVWSDGSTFDYSRWEDGEPNGDCGVDGCCVILVVPTGRWNDTPCEMWYPFVCKFTSSQPKLRPGNCLVFSRGGRVRVLWDYQH